MFIESHNKKALVTELLRIERLLYQTTDVVHDTVIDLYPQFIILRRELQQDIKNKGKGEF